LECIVSNRWTARASGGVYFWTDAGATSGVYVPSGGNAWSSLSDRNLKANITPVDGQEVLAHLATVPVATWNYTSQDASVRHMGPMAQDFYAAFGVGEDDRHISTVDADGVALAAIQGLYAENQALKVENAAQQAQIDDLAIRLAALEQGATRHPERSEGSLTSTYLPWLLCGGLVVAGGAVVVRRKRGQL